MGIKAAHERLISLIGPDADRNYFGVSYLYDHEILYMAGFQLLDKNETIPPGCVTYTLRKGNYISIFIPGFAEDLSLVQKAFEKLLDDPRIDEKGCCVECYLPGGSTFNDAKDLRCMVRLAD